eukprot:g904.t1
MAPYWFTCYRHWVVENIDKLNMVESILSKCVWLLPNRFAESEIGAESCRSILGLIQLWHETLFSSSKKDSEFNWSIALEAIQKVEVLFEMRASHLKLIGMCDKYTPLAALEFIKLMVRLFLMKSSRSLLETLNSSEDPPASPKEAKNAYHVAKAFKSLASSTTTGVNEAWYAARERQDSTDSVTPRAPSYSSSAALSEDVFKHQNDLSRCRSVDTAMGRKSDLQYSFWWNQPSLMEPMMDSDASPERLNSTRQEEPLLMESDSSEFCFKIGRMMILFGEILHLVRPLLTVICRRQFGSCSWKPWLISLGIDTASQILLSKGAELMKYAGVHKTDDLTLQDQILVYLTLIRNFQWTPVEEQELKRRKMMFLLYLMRSPAFALLTKPGLHTIERCLNVVPVLGTVLSKGLELLYGAQKYYVYTDGQY